MGNIKEAVEQAEKAAKTAERFPWGTSIVVAILSTLVVWAIMRESVKYSNRRADKCDDEKNTLVNNLLLKNNIIERYRDTVYVQQELIRDADSALKEATSTDAVKILKKAK